MQPKKVWAVYFSGTGTTEKTVRRIASGLSTALSAPMEVFDFTLPAARQDDLSFDPEDLVVLGVPTYAGRVPNVLLPYLTGKVHGAATPAVPVVLFGNRNFDDALMELRNILTANGFMPVAAAAFVGEHSFSRTLGAGRPNAADLAQMDDFARGAAQKLEGLAALPAVPVSVAGEEPIRPYYTPRDRHGGCFGFGSCAEACKFDAIHVVDGVAVVDKEKCTNCGACARVCPMGAIDPKDVCSVPGTCIKCCACVKGCPSGAKYFDDPGYLYHQHELEDVYTRRAENEWFV